MDYGRLAYIKTEELESAFRRRSAQSERRNSLGASFYPRAEIASGYSPCAISGEGSAGLTVSVTLRAPAGANGIKLSLYCGGKIAAYARVTLAEGETGRYSLLSAVYPAEGERLEIRSDSEGLVLEEFALLIEGNAVKITGGETRARCDCTNGKIYTAYAKNGYVYVCDESGKTASATHGGVFDISAADSNVYVICADDVGNLWGVRYNAELNETAREYLGDAPEKVALGLSPFGLTVAGLFGGEIRFMECEEDFSGRSDWVRADFETRADNVYFGKQSRSPALFLERDGHVFAKLPVPLLGFREHVSAQIRLAFGD